MENTEKEQPEREESTAAEVENSGEIKEMNDSSSKDAPGADAESDVDAAEDGGDQEAKSDPDMDQAEKTELDSGSIHADQSDEDALLSKEVARLESQLGLSGQPEKKIDFGAVGRYWEEEGKQNRKKLGLLLLLVLVLGCVTAQFVRYIQRPEPLPEMISITGNINYAPHYLFSVYGVSQPGGVAVSPDGNRIYVTETSGDHQIRIFDRGGILLNAFYVPFLEPGERSPVYIDIASNGNVFVTDRLQHAVFIFDSNGDYLDAIIGPNLSMTEYVSKHSEGGLKPGTEISFSRFRETVTFTQENGVMAELPAPYLFAWAPLGVHFTPGGNLLFTDVTDEAHSVRRMSLPPDWIPGESTGNFIPYVYTFGESGQGAGQLMFPNMAVSDLQGRVYVSDGNNSRVSIWDKDGNYLSNIGRGTGEESLGLPRGAAMDLQGRLFVVDAVDQSVKVYDVSGDEPAFLHSFGAPGRGEGQLNYPNDLDFDDTGRLYIADRENNRVQVWSY